MHLYYLSRNSKSAHILTHVLASVGVRNCSVRPTSFTLCKRVIQQVGQFLPIYKSFPAKNVSSPAGVAVTL